MISDKWEWIGDWVKNDSMVSELNEGGIKFMMVFIQQVIKNLIELTKDDMSIGAAGNRGPIFHIGIKLMQYFFMSVLMKAE